MIKQHILLWSLCWPFLMLVLSLLDVGNGFMDPGEKGFCIAG